MTISDRMLGTVGTLIAVLLLGLSDSRAIELKNASYFCAVEFAGGLAFNKTLKKWESAKFRADSKFILKLEFLRRGIQKAPTGVDEPFADFNVTITEAGTNNINPCFPMERVADLNVKMTGNFDRLNCISAFSEHVFNLKTNRFLAYYKYGYVDGNDNNDDTPGVFGGTCTKID